MSAPNSHPVWHPAAWASAAKLLGMFLLILGAKFWMLRMGSAPLPVFDQWEAEGQDLLRPWLRGELHPGDLFAPWIQHRIVWTRLLVLGLFQVNGQWDTQVEAIAAEWIHAVIALLLGIVLIRRLGRAWEDAILLGLLMLFALPIALANTFSGGFASQHYILLLFMVVAIWGLGSHRPGSVGWWAGVAGAISAWFAMATGALAAFAVAAWMAALLVRREGSARDHWLTLGVALALGCGGLSLGFGVEQIDNLKPHSAGEWLVRFSGLLGWPNPTAWAAPVAYAPFAWFVWRRWHFRQPTGPAEAFVIPLGIFGLLNTAALAYGRNHYGTLLVSRYMDLLSFGTLVNFLCLLLLLRETGGAGVAARIRAPFGLLAALWTVTAGYGLIQMTTHGLADTLPFTKICSQHEVENVAAFVAWSGPEKQACQSVSVTLSDNPRLANDLLQDAKILEILPAQVRLPIPLEAASATALVHRVTPDADNDLRSGWAMEPSPDHQPVHFQSRVIGGLRLPYLCFPAVSDMGSDVFMALVDERSGERTWLQPAAVRNGKQSILVKAPAGPFHVEAVIAAGSTRRLEFSYPREVGRLSAWVETVLDSAESLLCVGFALWLGAVFWRRLGLHALNETGGEVRSQKTTPPQENPTAA